MDNLENIIFLIFLALSFVFSVVKKLKKDDVQPPVPQQKEAPPQSSQSRKKAVSPVTPKLEFHSSYRPIYQPEEVEVTVSAFSHEQENNSGEHSLLEEIELNTHPILDIQNTDEIKRAIIYSEILCRKYE
jgi:hypothetical protein